MTEFTELTLPDGTSVLLQVSDLGPAGVRAPGNPEFGDLPEGAGETVAVGRGRNAGQALREALQPLGAVLDMVHGAVSSAVRPPDEISVELGVKVSQDLRLGIVSGGGEATLTVNATWRIGRASVPTQISSDQGMPSATS
ncbi:CU044_2847 family protein [Kitasatospora sp. NPDC002040]|uniref:CU044_2847 family protein n=1 Tax=Kitasatospora sp. NPDC002040 TaxID=3154661 RepID=UPI0033210F0D